jgi:hypothetical protein
LEELGGWPILGTGPGGNWSENEFSLSKLLISLHQYNNYPVIGMFVGYDDRESTKNIIHVCSFLLYIMIFRHIRPGK